jgi:SpoVK/Ycf46/Vps4 family AAA+-type ATPase
MFLAEELLGKLLKILGEHLDRDPSHYTFITKSGAIKKEDFSYLQSFLETEHVPFAKVGVNLSSQSLLPAFSFIETREGRQPCGLYFIYPHTDREIIFYFHEDLDESFREGQRRITGFRSDEVLEKFFREYRAFALLKERQRPTIKVYRGEEIERPSLSWDDLILPPVMKEEIRWHVESFMAGESAYRRLAVPYKRGFLFVGPPGNGKTMLLKVIASHYPDWKFIFFSLPPGGDNDEVDEVFRQARELAPSILCFEDLDSLFRGSASLSHFLNKLDGFEDIKGTLMLATTNHPERIDTALTNRPSRFDRVWMIDNPARECRRLFIERNFKDIKDGGLIARMASGTDGFSMAHLKELYVSASMLALDRGLDYPGEAEVMESLKGLSRQVIDEKNDFVRDVKTIGFAAA